MAYNYLNNQPQQNFSQYQSPQMFPQPNGNLYTINTSNELTNIPVGIGLSAILCLPENKLYLKSLQNGNPVIWSYNLISGEGENKPATVETVEKDYSSYFRAIDEKYNSIDERLKKVEKYWEEKF